MKAEGDTADGDETGFGGFPAATLKFLRDLSKNNDKDWFEAHRADYEAQYRHPARHFCAVMEARLGEVFKAPFTSKIYRINRDLRFSKDKTPYNTHLHISFLRNAGPAPSLAFGLDPETMSVGVGTFGFDKALDAYRERVAGKAGAALAREIDALVKKGARLGGEPELKRVPAPYPPDHPRADLLRRKSLTMWLDFDSPKAATSPTLIEDCLERYTNLLPIFGWLENIR